MLPGIGIFGTDPVVKTLVPFLQAKGFRVEALWGLTFQDAQATAKELSVPFWTNKVDDVLLRKDVELVFVLCPPNLHSQIAVKALGIGKHVLCDRPAGLSQCEALKMVLAAQYYPSLICVLSHGLRFHPAFVAMKRNLSKFVGDVRLVHCNIEMGPILGQSFNWLCDDVMGGGNVTLFGSHIIDLMTYLTGLRAVRVHGVLKTFTQSTACISGTRRITSPDFAVIQMEMENGVLVSITLNNHLGKDDFHQEILVCGSNGYLKAQGAKVTGLCNTDQPDSRTPVVLYDECEDGDLKLVDRSTGGKAKETSPLLPQIFMAGLMKLVGALREAFIAAEGGQEWKTLTSIGMLGAGFEEGLYVQAVVEAIRRSSKENSWVKVNVLTEEPDPNPVLTAAVRTSTISM